MSITVTFNVIEPILDINAQKIFPGWFGYVRKYMSDRKIQVPFLPSTLIEWAEKIYGPKARELVIAKAELCGGCMVYSLENERLSVLEDFRGFALADCRIDDPQKSDEYPHSLSIGSRDWKKIETKDETKYAQGRTFTLVASKKDVIMKCNAKLEEVVNLQVDRASRGIELSKDTKIVTIPLLICKLAY